MSHTIVHRSSPGAVDAVLDRLADGGVEAFALDEPNAIVLLVSFGTYRIRVAVPEGQAEEAHRILADWDRESSTKLADLTGQMRRQFIGVTLLVLVIGVLVVLIGGLQSNAHWVLLFLLPLWFAILLTISAIQRARARKDPGA